jgi:hypothetical protein
MTTRYRALYDLALAAYEEEMRRLDLIVGKAYQNLQLLVFMLGLVMVSGQWWLKRIVPPQNSLAWLIVVANLTVVAILVWASFEFLRIIRGPRLSRLPLSEEVIDFYHRTQLDDDVYFAMAKTIHAGYLENRPEIDTRARALAAGHRLTQWALGAMILTSSLSVAYHWTHREVTMMADSDSETTSDKAPVPQEPKTQPSASPPATPTTAPAPAGPSPSEPAKPGVNPALVAPAMPKLWIGAADPKNVVKVTPPEPPKSKPPEK